MHYPFSILCIIQTLLNFIRLIWLIPCKGSSTVVGMSYVLNGLLFENVQKRITVSTKKI